MKFYRKKHKYKTLQKTGTKATFSTTYNQKPAIYQRPLTPKSKYKKLHCTISAVKNVF
jgi:hypothetical protein